MSDIRLNGNFDELMQGLRDELFFFSPRAAELKRAVAVAANATAEKIVSALTMSKSPLSPASDFNVKPKVVRSSIRNFKASAKAGRLTARLTLKDRAQVPLVQYRSGMGRMIKVKVLKSHAVRAIQPGGIHNIAATRKGKAGVWVAKGNIMARAAGDRKPFVLFCPSYMAFFKREGVLTEIEAKQRELMETNLTKFISMAKAGKLPKSRFDR